MTNLWNEDANRASSAYVRYDLQGHSHTGNTGVDNAPDRWASLYYACQARNITLYTEPTTQFVVHPKSVHLTLSSEFYITTYISYPNHKFTLHWAQNFTFYTNPTYLYFVPNSQLYIAYWDHSLIHFQSILQLHMYSLHFILSSQLYTSYRIHNFTLHTELTSHLNLPLNVTFHTKLTILYFLLSSRLYIHVLY